MPENGFVQLKHMFQDVAESRFGFRISSRQSHSMARTLLMREATGRREDGIEDPTGEEAVFNVLTENLARTGSLSGRAS